MPISVHAPTRALAIPLALATFLSMDLPVAAGGTAGKPCEVGPDESCTRRERTFDLVRVSSETDELRGPVTLVFEGINRLRYDVVVDQEVSFSDGPNLSLVPIIPSLGAATPAEDEKRAEDASKGTGPPAADAFAEDSAEDERIGQEFQSIEDRTGELAKVVGALRKEAESAREALSEALEKFEDLVAESDSLLRNRGAEGLADELPKMLRCFSTARASHWPGPGEVAAALNEVRGQEKKLAELARTPGFNSWYWTAPDPGQTSNRNRFEKVEQRIESLKGVLAELGPESDVSKAYRRGLAFLGDADRLVSSLRDEKTPAAPFRMRVCVPCGFPRFKTKETVVELVYTERFPETGKEPKVTRRKVATVVCPSRFSLAAGFGVSGIEERTFTLVQSLPDPEPMDAPEGMGEIGGSQEDNGDDPDPAEESTLVKRIDEETATDNSVTATALIHTELFNHEGKKLATGFHFSAGAALALDGGTENTLGYLAGLSLSLQENLFLTAGWQIQQVKRLAGGFEVGQQVPDDLPSPPTKTVWEDAWTFTVTYKMGS